MSPRGIRLARISKSLIAIVIGLVMFAVVYYCAYILFSRDFGDIAQDQNQVEDSLATVLKGSMGDWCVIVDYFLLPYIRITDSRGERWFRVVAVDDSALYISKYASLAVITGGEKEGRVKVSQNPVDIEDYDTFEEFLERFSGKCGEKMKDFCKKHNLPYGKIKEVCCSN